MPMPLEVDWGIGSYGPTNCVQIMIRDHDLLYRQSKLVSNGLFLFCCFFFTGKRFFFETVY